MRPVRSARLFLCILAFAVTLFSHPTVSQTQSSDQPTANSASTKNKSNQGKVDYLYNIRVESGGSGESTNCHFTKPADVDWHMYFVKDAGGGEAVAVIAETTPRVRQNHPSWDVTKLKPWEGTGAAVRLSGWLMLDPEHPDVVEKYRGTIWEIHPVTKIEVQQNGTWVDADSLQ